MPTLADFGLTARPSTRDIRASANSSTGRPEKYESRNAYDPEFEVTVADAEAAVKARYPQLFESEQSIRDRINKQGLVGNEASRVFRSTIRNNTYTRKSEVDAMLQRLQGEASEKQKQKVAAELAETRRVANEELATRRAAESKTVTDAGARGGVITEKSKRVNTAMSPEDLRAMNFLEMSARVAMSENPALYEGFEDYQSYSTQLANMEPSAREAELQALREEANDIVDPYFDTKERQVRDDLKLALQEIDDKFSLFTEAEKYQLGQKIEGLDRDAAETLQSQFIDMKRRGVMDSGIARGIADKIIEGKTRSQEFEETISEFSTRNEKMKNEYAVKKNERAAERLITDIEHEKETERGKQFFGLLEEQEASTFLQQYPSASRLNVYGDEGTGPPPATQGSALPPRALPSASAPAGSSLDLARRAASGAISVDEQKRQRDLLLNSPKPAPAPAPVAKVTTPTPSRTTNPGTILLQNAVAARKAARVAKLK